MYGSFMLMNCEMKNFIIIFATLAAVDCRQNFSCPYLIRANNWEIEKFFGTWNAIESFSHVESDNIKEQEICASLHVREVNELHEPMTYGQIADPFNFRFAHRYLEINFITNIKTFTHFLSFNNSNQMLWKGNDIVMQIIKFDGKPNGNQMMTTICLPKEEFLFTILLDQRNYDEVASDIATKFNHLILKGRNLKVHSNLICKIELDSSASPKFNFNLPSMNFFVISNLLILLANVLLSI